MKFITLAIALLTASAFAADKPGSAKVTGTVIAPKAVKDIAGLTLELRLYEYDPFLADAAADLVATEAVKRTYLVDPHRALTAEIDALAAALGETREIFG